jgi:hypothetical protein
MIMAPVTRALSDQTYAAGTYDSGPLFFRTGGEHGSFPGRRARTGKGQAGSFCIVEYLGYRTKASLLQRHPDLYYETGTALYDRQQPSCFSSNSYPRVIYHNNQVVTNTIVRMNVLRPYCTSSVNRTPRMVRWFKKSITCLENPRTTINCTNNFQSSSRLVPEEAVAGFKFVAQRHLF